MLKINKNTKEYLNKFNSNYEFKIFKDKKNGHDSNDYFKYMFLLKDNVEDKVYYFEIIVESLNYGNYKFSSPVYEIDNDVFKVLTYRELKFALINNTKSNVFNFELKKELEGIDFQILVSYLEN